MSSSSHVPLQAAALGSVIFWLAVPIEAAEAPFERTDTGVVPSSRSCFRHHSAFIPQRPAFYKGGRSHGYLQSP